MSEAILSILTPGLPSRIDQIEYLCDEVLRQIANLEIQVSPMPVEHLVFIDNKKRTVGEKRDALLVAAKGKYVAFVDDDDDISNDYVESLLEAAKSDPDVITFMQEANINGKTAIVDFRLGSPNEAFQGVSRECSAAAGGAVPAIRRNAWHVCAWRRTLAIQSHFPASNYGEDWAYASKLCALPNLREVHIDKVLHFYRHSSATTEAPPPLTGPEKYEAWTREKFLPGVLERKK